MEVFVYAVAVVFICCLLGIGFLILSKIAKVRERLYTYRNLSWIFFFIAIGVAIGTVAVYFIVELL